MKVVFETGGNAGVIDYHTLFQYTGVAVLLLFSAWVVGNIYDAFCARSMTFGYVIKAVVRVLVILTIGIYLMGA